MLRNDGNTFIIYDSYGILILDWNFLTLIIPLASSPIWNNIETENKAKE